MDIGITMPFSSFPHAIKKQYNSLFINSINMKTKLLSILLVLLTIIQVNAQEKKEYTNFTDTTFNINEVTVRAQREKRPEALKLNVPSKYLPISINTLPAEKLEIRGIQDIQVAARFMPGVRINTSYGGFQTLYVRGFGNAPIMFDGIMDQRTTINSFPWPDLSAIENMELMKGSSSVMYGHSSIGGILNIVRKGPSEERTASAEIAYGSWNYKRATMSMGGKLIGPVNYFANVNFSDQDGWRDNGDKKFSGYLALGAKLSEKDHLDIRGAFNRDFYGTEIGLPDLMANDVYNADGSPFLKKGQMLPGLNKEARYNNESDFYKHHAWNIMGTYTHTFSENLKLEDKFYYMDDDINYFGTEALDYLESDEAIYDHYYLKGDKKRYICLDTVELTFPLRFSHITKTAGNQLELSGKLFTGNVSHNFLGGYSFTAINRNSYTGYVLGDDVKGPGLFSHVSVYDPHSMGYMTSKFGKATITHNYIHSLYLQDLIELNDHWKVLLAGRYDNYKYMSSNSITPSGKREWSKEDQTAYSAIKNNAFTYRVGVVYLPDPSVSVYGSIASFFKPIRTLYSPTTVYVDKEGYVFEPKMNEQIFKPESGYQAEIGSKYTLNNMISANASLFYIRRENATQRLGSMPVEENGTTTNKTITGQVGVMDSKGFDIEFTFTPVSSMNITTGYSFTDARIRDIATVKDPAILEYVTSGLDDNSGNYQTMVPKNNFYALGDYVIPKGVFKNLGFMLSVSFMDKVYRNVANDKWFESYWLTDLGVSYKLPGNVRIRAMINNIFDADYYDQALGDQLVPSKPRNFLVSLSYKL